jgi:hypothetical protein
MKSKSILKKFIILGFGWISFISGLLIKRNIYSIPFLMIARVLP